MSERAVYLYSSLATDQLQIVNSRRLEDVLNGKKVVFDRVDGSQTDQKEVRDELFKVSGQRGKYPQCFIKGEAGYRFVGLWEEVESLVDCDALPADILASNPSINTFSKVVKISLFRVLANTYQLRHYCTYRSLPTWRNMRSHCECVYEN
ncbi:hypothetical protein EON65_25395 [archaeon]|nr:MAG: hypothetical protein EON65_25395 [archaeon]